MMSPGLDAGILEWARYYIHRGWCVVPIPPGQKKPHIKNWPKLRISESEIPKYFDRAGMVYLGRRS